MVSKYEVIHVVQVSEVRARGVLAMDTLSPLGSNAKLDITQRQPVQRETIALPFIKSGTEYSF